MLDSAPSPLLEANLGDDGIFYTSTALVRPNNDLNVDSFELAPLEISLAPDSSEFFDATVTIKIEI